MQGCYVDRMIIGRRVVERRFPTISTWTMELMKNRQEVEQNVGGFGRGFYVDRMVKEDVDRDKALLSNMDQAILCEEECNNIQDVSLDGTDNMSDVISPSEAMEEVYKAGVVMAQGITNFVDKLKVVPSSIRNLQCFKVAARTGRSLVGLTGIDPPLGREETVAALTQAMSDEPFHNPEWLQALETMMEAVDKKIEFDNYQPNWDLFGDYENEVNFFSENAIMYSMLLGSKGTSNRGGTINMSEAADEQNNDTTGNANDPHGVSSHQVTVVEIEFHFYCLYITLLTYRISIFFENL